MKIKISAYQMFASIIVFEYGTAVLFFIIPEAKRDAWFVILIYIIPAIILQIIYTSLWNKYPQDTIVTYMPKIFGKFIGYFLSTIYIAYFTYLAARVIRDFSELVLISVMPKMPLILISIILVLVISYGAFTGIENLSRFAQLFFPMLLLFIIMTWLFPYMTSGTFELSNLMPVLENGITPVIKKGWPLLTFPFGETIVFSMLYPSIVETTKVRKSAILATLFTGIILSLNSIIFISVLGEDLSLNSLFPFLQTMRTMKLGDSFDRLDIFIIAFLMLGGFFKICFFMSGAIFGTSQLINLKNSKYLVIPFGIIVLVISQLISSNYPQHIKIGLDFTVKYIHIPLIIVVPLIALTVYYLKIMIKKL